MRSSKITINYWKSISQENQSAGKKLVREEQRRVQDASLFPVYYGSAKKGLGIQPLMDAVTGLFQPIGEQGSAALCGSVFKVEYTDCGQRRVYLRLYSGTRCAAGYGGPGRERKAENHRDAYSIQRGNCSDRHRLSGEIVILPSDSVRLNDVLGDPTRLPRKGGVRTPSPCCGRRLRRKRQRKENGCWTLLRNLRILTRFCAARWIPSPMRSFFLFWAGCSWRLFPLCCRKNTSLKQW